MRINQDPYRDLYPSTLKEVPVGHLFMMLNYTGIYMRVEADKNVMTIREGRMANPLPFNDDGCHLPILDMATGSITWMSREKPCRCYSDF